MRIVLDTSFVVNAVKYRLDFRKQLTGNELFGIQTVVEEVENLSNGKSKDASNAKMALRMIQNIQALGEPDETEGDADASLAILAKKGFAVATQDMLLRKKIEK